MRFGDNLIADVYDALRSNEAVWMKSALIVTYDEHGGFYDHVAPPEGIANPDGINSPAPNDPAPASRKPPFAFDRLGVRVPAIIASPWVARGKVDSTRYQHTSILATLRKMFGLRQPLTHREAQANSFEGLFTQLTAARTDTPLTLPRIPLPQQPLFTAAGVPVAAGDQPLNSLQDEMLEGFLELTHGAVAAAAPPAAAAAAAPSAAPFATTQAAASALVEQRLALLGL